MDDFTHLNYIYRKIQKLRMVHLILMYICALTKLLSSPMAFTTDSFNFDTINYSYSDTIVVPC